ncbi:MAG: hypothetical protein MK105_08460 [Crocinitomicaceae bacterium]|nr:hypothetical protein [Crocinitomicaceae bacterium]
MEFFKSLRIPWKLQTCTIYRTIDFSKQDFKKCAGKKKSHLRRKAQRQKEKIKWAKLFVDFSAKNIRLTIFEWTRLFNIMTNYRAIRSSKRELAI